jgi:hypothetical protein
VELEHALGRVADRIAEQGTAVERGALHAVAGAARWLSPAAATALVDWTASESTRLRAYGVLQGVVLRGLDRDDHAWLLDRLQATRRVCHSGSGAGARATTRSEHP